MSESPNPSVPADQPSPAAKPKKGNIVSRSIIVLMLILLAIEVHGKFGYDRTMTQLNAHAATVAGAPVAGRQPQLEAWSMPLAEAEKCVSGFPSKSPKSPTSYITLKWFSFFKTYVIRLHLDDDNIVDSLSTGDVEPPKRPDPPQMAPPNTGEPLPAPDAPSRR